MAPSGMAAHSVPPSPFDSADSESKSSDDCSLVCGDSNSLPVAAAAVVVIVEVAGGEEPAAAAAAVVVVVGADWRVPRVPSTWDSVSAGPVG